MGVPLRQQIAIAGYILRQRLAGRRRYPLVLMLEPLFRCNLACAGCGKIDYPDEILNRRLSVAECLAAVDECGAPVVSIPGGEPLLHKEIDAIVAGIVARRRYVYLCTNGLLLERKLDLFTPSPYLTFSVHLDGLEAQHDQAVCQPGVFARAVSAIRAAIARGFRVTCNTTVFTSQSAEDIAKFLDFTRTLGIEAVTISPGYAYERAPDQEHFLRRQATVTLFRTLFRLGRGRGWQLNHSPLYLDFLAGNQAYTCTPWGSPTRNVLGWQRPCYLINEGVAESYAALMADTDWGAYGTGVYEKCADCMAHCGFEPTAVNHAVDRPLALAALALRGLRTEGPMVPAPALDRQRPALQVFDRVIAAAVGPETGSGGREDGGAGNGGRRG